MHDYIYVCICIYISMYICVYIHIYIFFCCVHMFTYMCRYVHTYIYIYIFWSPEPATTDSDNQHVHTREHTQSPTYDKEQNSKDEVWPGPKGNTERPFERAHHI